MKYPGKYYWIRWPCFILVGLISQISITYIFYLVLVREMTLTSGQGYLVARVLEWVNLISLFLSILIAWAVTIPIKRKYAHAHTLNSTPPPAP